MPEHPGKFFSAVFRTTQKVETDNILPRWAFFLTVKNKYDLHLSLAYDIAATLKSDSGCSTFPLPVSLLTV
jgi:hypothetical protein